MHTCPALLWPCSLATLQNSLFGPERSSVASDVAHNLCEVLGIRNDVDVPKHLEVGKVLGNALLLERLHKGVVRVQVRDDLESALERYDLPLEMPLQDAVALALRTSRTATGTHDWRRMPTSW